MSTQLEAPVTEVGSSVISPQPAGGTQPAGSTSWTVWHLFWLGLFLAVLPMLVVYFARMRLLPHYHYFPFAVGAVVWLAYSRSDRTIPPPANWLSLLLLVGATAFFVGSLVLNSPWFGAIAFVGVSASLLLVMKGPSDRSLMMLCLPLLLLVRLPLNYDGQLIISLQRITTQLSSLLLDMLGVPHAVARNTIQLAERELFVAEACSGIQSVFTLAFLATLLIVIYRRRVWLTPLYLVIALVLAVAGNVLRVSAVAAADSWFKVDIAEGWSHDVLGYVTLGIAVLFLLSFDRLIISFFHPIVASGAPNPVVGLWNALTDPGQDFDVLEEYVSSGVRSRTKSESVVNPWLLQKLQIFDMRSVRIPTACAGVLMLVTSSVLAFTKNAEAFRSPNENDNGFLIDKMYVEPTKDFFRAVANDFELNEHKTARGGDNPILGTNADQWKYSKRLKSGQMVSGSVVLSQAYTGWHDLSVCYAINDWSQNVRKRIDGTSASGEQIADPKRSGTFDYVQFSNDNDEIGYLWFAGVGANGQVIRLPEMGNRVSQRLRVAVDSASEVTDECAMIQLWIVSVQKMEVADTQEIAKDFESLLTHFASAIAEQYSKAEQSQ